MTALGLHLTRGLHIAVFEQASLDEVVKLTKRQDACTVDKRRCRARMFGDDRINRHQLVRHCRRCPQGPSVVCRSAARIDTLSHARPSWRTNLSGCLTQTM